MSSDAGNGGAPESDALIDIADNVIDLVEHVEAMAADLHFLATIAKFGLALALGILALWLVLGLAVVTTSGG